ncbi:MAG TPA: PspC family transcriptional regulator [Flavobacteriales bacterium]|nr:PspC family transcriptional regulator [Flavobacteriales bacterium]
MERIKGYFEKQAFGVCDYLGNKLGMDSSRIRVFFIYISFITIGSTLIFYLILAFFIEHRYLFKKKRRSIWDL